MEELEAISQGKGLLRETKTIDNMWVFLLITVHGCESWIRKKAERQGKNRFVFKCGVGEGLYGYPGPPERQTSW